jgi:hypothetical protein
MKNSSFKFTTKLTAAGLFLVLAVVSLNALADGSGERDATQAEKDFHRTVYAVIAKAVPAAPAGWNINGDSSSNKELKRTFNGAEKYPFKVEYWTNWDDTKRVQEAQMKMVEEMSKLTSLPPAEIAKKSDELNKKYTPHDVSVRIEIKANVFYTSFNEKASPAAPVAGGQAFRSDSGYSENSGWHEGSTWVFLGKNWKLNKQGGTYVEAAADKTLPSTEVQTILVKIKADPDRAKQIISKMDWEALKKLIK